MSVDPDTFRTLLGRFATGVTVVTVRDESGQAHGMTVSAFASVSLDPPIILVCIDRNAEMWKLLHPPMPFAVNILAEDQEPVSRRFASDDASTRFDGISLTEAEGNIPLLADAHANLVCRAVQRLEAGDHAIVMGEVARGSASGHGSPLIYYRSGYASLTR